MHFFQFGSFKRFEKIQKMLKWRNDFHLHCTSTVSDGHYTSTVLKFVCVAKLVCHLCEFHRTESITLSQANAVGYEQEK